jgi:hypothetical protein
MLPKNQTTCDVALSVWMPIAREIIAVQFGCVGLWLWQRFNGWGLATVGILGAINIPYFIILGEFGIAVLLALLAK